MNSVQEWDDALQHFDLEDFLEVLTKVVGQCSLMYLSTSALLVLVGGWVTSFFLCHSRGGPPQFCQITRGWATENQYLKKNFIAYPPPPLYFMTGPLAFKFLAEFNSRPFYLNHSLTKEVPFPLNFSNDALN